MTRAGRRGVAALALLLGPALGACGQDEAALTADEQQAADNLAAQILRSGSVAGREGVDAAEADCVAQGAVLDVGLDRLQDYGIVTADLKVDRTIQGVRMTARDARALAAVFTECLETERLFEKQALSRKLTKPQRRCIRRVIDEETVEQVLADSFQGASTTAADALRRRLGRCTSG